jgi:hypothetical protein
LIIAYNHIDSKRRFGIVSSCLVLLLACSSLGSEDELTLNEFTSDFVSADLWLENSRELILQKNTQAIGNTFYSEIPSDDLSVQIFLDLDNEVSQVNVPLTSSLSKTLYFDYGRLAFSETKFDGETQLMSAYADGRAYAHALPDGSTPEAGQLTSGVLNQSTIRSIISIAKNYSLKEKNATHNTRITENEMSILDSVSVQKDFTAVMNVRQGEKMNVNLISNAPHVYFTISPSNGSDMEYKSWSGPAIFTGDVEIRVFVAEDIRDGSFRLDVKHSTL